MCLGEPGEGMGQVAGVVGSGRGRATGTKLTCRMWSMAPLSVEAPPVPGEAVSPSTWGRGRVLWSLCSKYRLRMTL